MLQEGDLEQPGNVLASGHRSLEEWSILSHPTL